MLLPLSDQLHFLKYYIYSKPSPLYFTMPLSLFYNSAFPRLRPDCGQYFPAIQKIPPDPVSFHPDCTDGTNSNGPPAFRKLSSHCPTCKKER